MINNYLLFEIGLNLQFGYLGAEESGVINVAYFIVCQNSAKIRALQRLLECVAINHLYVQLGSLYFYRFTVYPSDLIVIEISAEKIGYILVPQRVSWVLLLTSFAEYYEVAGGPSQELWSGHYL